jgi:hypothetical protein
MKTIAADIQEIKQGWAERRKQAKYDSTSKNYQKSQIEYQDIEKRYYDLLKNSTILSGSIFGSSISLAVGKDVGLFFIFGEFMLLASTIWGIIFLWNRLQVKEWSYFMLTKSRLQSDLLQYEDAMEDFEVLATKNHIETYSKLINKKTILNKIFNIINVDWLPSLFYISLLTGLIFIWLSLVF